MSDWNRSMTYWATEIRQALDALGDDVLPARAYRILQLRAEGQTYSEIGAALDITRERTMQLSAGALARAKEVLADTPAGFHIWERFG